MYTLARLYLEIFQSHSITSKFFIRSVPDQCCIDLWIGIIYFDYALRVGALKQRLAMYN